MRKLLAASFLTFIFCADSARAAKGQTLSDIKKILQSLEDKQPIPGPLHSDPFLKRQSSKTAQKPLSEEPPLQLYSYVDHRPSFDLPVTYNRSVKSWLNYFQGPGRKWFRTWLERSHRYLPLMTETLGKKGLPQDLAYVAMIESGFSSKATSEAKAVGYWQFIKATANRYGLRTTWWLDERRDFTKSTLAAANYLEDLFRLFGSWYLAAAAYNMGEGKTQRLVQKYQTRNFWELARKKEFPKETREYIPKLIAAMLIAKAPGLYGFHDLKPLAGYSYEFFQVPGGTDLYALAKHLRLDRQVLTNLNPELLRGYIPKEAGSHRIRVPRGHLSKVHQFLRAQLDESSSSGVISKDL